MNGDPWAKGDAEEGPIPQNQAGDTVEPADRAAVTIQRESIPAAYDEQK